MNGATLRLLLAGPTAVIILVSFLACTALLAVALGRVPHFTTLCRRAAGRLGWGRAGLMLWGLTAGLMTVIVAAILFGTKVLAGLGLVVLLGGLTLASLGLGVGAVRVGRSLALGLGRPQPPPLLALTVGLTTFFLAAFLPFVGWLFVLLTILAGIGASLDTLLRRG